MGGCDDHMFRVDWGRGVLHSRRFSEGGLGEATRALEGFVVGMRGKGGVDERRDGRNPRSRLFLALHLRLGEQLMVALLRLQRRGRAGLEQRGGRRRLRPWGGRWRRRGQRKRGGRGGRRWGGRCQRRRGWAEEQREGAGWDCQQGMGGRGIWKREKWRWRSWEMRTWRRDERRRRKSGRWHEGVRSAERSGGHVGWGCRLSRG